MKTVADVEEVLRAIETRKDDDESAHGAEDALHLAVLRAIADGTAEQPREMAAAALRSKEIDFGRWCA